jgi:hypothetical protein
VSTLRECGIMRNGKLMLACAEAVEDGTSLWKGKEKAEKILKKFSATDFRGLTRIEKQS